jgi:hypothetical protein
MDRIESQTVPASLPNANPEARLSRVELAARLTAAGFKISEATLATKAARGGGPPYKLWGREAVYVWSSALEWANANLKEPRRLSGRAETSDHEKGRKE